MIEKLKTHPYEDESGCVYGTMMPDNQEIMEKINELVDAVNNQQIQLNNHMCRLMALEHTEEPAEILDTEYVTIKEDDVYVGGKPTTQYNGEDIYRPYLCVAYFKEARDIIREEYGYELLELHCLQSSTDGEYAKTGNPVSDKNGTNCWVRCVYKNEKGTPADSLWVFYHTYSSASDCAYNCAYNCGNDVRYNSAMRSGLFGSVRN